MVNRTKHTYGVQIYDFIKDIYVICPNCSAKAIVKTGEFHKLKYNEYEVKVVCTACGFNQTLEHVSPRIDKKQKRGNILIFGAPVDPFFHLPVWFSTSFEGETLWAYNTEHLDFLAEHIGSKLRERNNFSFNVKSIGARLPKWMTSANNREDLLKAIHKLKLK